MLQKIQENVPNIADTWYIDVHLLIFMHGDFFFKFVKTEKMKRNSKKPLGWATAGDVRTISPLSVTLNHSTPAVYMTASHKRVWLDADSEITWEI